MDTYSGVWVDGMATLAHVRLPSSPPTQTKNVEVQHAVDDLIRAVTAYALDPRVERVPDEELLRLRRHYNHFMFQALLHCAKNSMDALKKRIAPRAQLPAAAGMKAAAGGCVCVRAVCDPKRVCLVR